MQFPDHQLHLPTVVGDVDFALCIFHLIYIGAPCRRRSQFVGVSNNELNVLEHALEIVKMILSCEPDSSLVFSLRWIAGPYTHAQAIDILQDFGTTAEK